MNIIDNLVKPFRTLNVYTTMEKLKTSQSYKNQKYVNIVRDTVNLLNSMKDINLNSTMFKDAYNGALHELTEASISLLESYGYHIPYSESYVEDMRTGKRVDFEHPETFSSYYHEGDEYRLIERMLGEHVAIYFVCEALEFEVNLKG